MRGKITISQSHWVLLVLYLSSFQASIFFFFQISMDASSTSISSSFLSLFSPRFSGICWNWFDKSTPSNDRRCGSSSSSTMDDHDHSKKEIFSGDFRYVLEDVPHLIDYLPNLSVTITLPICWQRKHSKKRKKKKKAVMK